MTLIDAVYINSPGGITLLKLLIEGLINRNVDFKLLVDKRRINYVKNEKIKAEIISSNEWFRIKFYLKNKNEFKNVFCLSNVPPPIQLNCNVHVYFHNLLLIDSKSSSIAIKSDFLFFLKRNYIKLLNKPQYNWHVQNYLVQKKLNDLLLCDAKKINVTPFFKNINKNNYSGIPKSSNSFIYVAHLSPHKNHIRLLKGFILAASRSRLTFQLGLTLSKRELNKILFKLKVPSNLILEPLGHLSSELILNKYKEYKFFIYPSLKESYGLPLIEASLLELIVIAADLEYVHEVIFPSLTFNPLNVDDISKTIIKAVSLKDIKRSILKTTNKLDSLINLISNDV